MLELDESLFVNRGLHRECYRHPRRPDICVKVVVNGEGTEVDRELHYYGVLANRGIRWEMLPRYHGPIKTNMGFGHQFELVRDFDGGISKSLEYYFSSEDLSRNKVERIGEALVALRRYLVEQGIVTMTLKPKNMLFKRLDVDRGVLVIVDNIGTSDFIPICNYSIYFARHKIRRKWARFEALLQDRFGADPKLGDMLHQLRYTY